MTETRHDSLKMLHRSLDPDRPVEDMSLYVDTELRVSRDVIDRLQLDPAEQVKLLLVGARGCGKSTELRRIHQVISEQGPYLVETLDLDESGITASSVGAFDLLYLCGLALLRRLPEDAQQAKLFAGLKTAYQDSSSDALGEVKAALQGLAGFATKTGAATGSAAALAIGGATAAAAIGVRLLTGRARVSESSAAGQRLQLACSEITRAVRKANQDARPILLLVDGLEKMNGEANTRFREVFEYTRLLFEAEWSMVVASPPSTLTASDSVMNVGYETTTVWGFQGERDALRDLVRKRTSDVGVDHEALLADADLNALIDVCGGIPRHLVSMARHAAFNAWRSGAATVRSEDVDYGISKFGQELARGLNDEHRDILKKVKQSKTLPDDGQPVASLFAGGKIIAVRPPVGQLYPRYVVHPLLDDPEWPE